MLAELARHARHPVLVVNDGDIFVPPGYLDAVVAPLADAGTGLVTCLYRAHGGSAATRMEALGIATDFAPSVMVARLLGVAEFALGSTMAFRAETLRAIGGFETIFDYLADDYQLGRHIHQLGLHIVFADVVVETNLGAGSWRAGLAAPVALGAHHPRLAVFRLLRLDYHPRHVVEPGGAVGRSMVGGHSGPGAAHRSRHLDRRRSSGGPQR